MSSSFWQMQRQRELLPPGQTVTKRICDYVERWESRCYSKEQGGIPEEAPSALVTQGRVPCWRGLALAILKNDHTLKSLGCGVGETPVSLAILATSREKGA